MSKLRLLLMIVLLSGFSSVMQAQQISKEELIFLTPEWKGERFADGRPKVPDNILKRMKQVSVEEAWAVMKNVGYAIFAKSGNGIVYDGALRDIEGLKEIGGFTSYFTSYDPSYHNPPGDLNTMIIGLNQPTRIRNVTVMPG